MRSDHPPNLSNKAAMRRVSNCRQVSFSGREEVHMRSRVAAAVVIMISAPPISLAGDVEAAGENYRAMSYFTAELNDGIPGEKIERAHLGMERVVLFTDWQSLEDKPHLQEVRVYDPYDALVYTWHYEFTPMDGAFNVWFWWWLCETRDAPGLWRFEVYLDEKHAFDNRIMIFEQE